ncbi:MAG: hypothetical protein M5U19_13535 [Microthrixaceae bacterium]|nr:hypothetical protein [Microthrixaceae bacterium]
MIAALFPLAVPQLGFVGGSVNNDNLVVLAASLTFLSCARILHVRMDRGAAALLAGGTALALMAKGNAIALVPFVVLVAVVAWRRGGQQRRFAVVAVSVGSAGWTVLCPQPDRAQRAVPLELRPMRRRAQQPIDLSPSLRPSSPRPPRRSGASSGGWRSPLRSSGRSR